MPAQI